MSERPITPRDLKKLASIRGLSAVDLAYLLGLPSTSSMRWSSPEPVKLEIAILVRYLLKHPEALQLPEYPEPEDIYPLVAPLALKHPVTSLGVRPNAEENRYPVTRMGLLLGKSGWCGAQWFASRADRNEVLPVIGRLCKIIADAIEEKGKKGFQEYLDVLDEELKARGYENGLEDLMRNLKPPKTAKDEPDKDPEGD